jgi:hypothetical protein
MPTIFHYPIFFKEKRTCQRKVVNYFRKYLPKSIGEIIKSVVLEKGFGF